jgi:hypothetical protein
MSIQSQQAEFDFQSYPAGLPGNQGQPNGPAGVRIVSTFGGERSALRWNYYSVKNFGYVACVSADGLRALYHAEVSTDVVGYHTHLEPVHFKVGRRSASFKAHLEETLLDGRIVVSAFADLIDEDDPKQAEAIAGARAHYGALGIGFRVRGRPEIAEQATADAVEAIQTFRRTSFTDDDIWLVKDALGDRSSAPLAELRDCFKSPALGFAKLSAMMVRRVVAIDLHHELGPASAVRLIDPY